MEGGLYQPCLAIEWYDISEKLKELWQKEFRKNTGNSENKPYGTSRKLWWILRKWKYGWAWRYKYVLHTLLISGIYKICRFWRLLAHIAWRRTGVFSRHSRKTIEVTWIAEERGPSAVHGGRTVSNIIRPVFYWIMIRVCAFRQAKAAETHKLCVLQSSSSVNYYKPASWGNICWQWKNK